MNHLEPTTKQTFQIMSTTKDELMTTILTNKRILNPQTPRDTANMFLIYCCTFDGMRTLQCVHSSGQFYRWIDKHYQPLSDLQVKSELAEFLNLSYMKKKASYPNEEADEDGNILVKFNTTNSKENEIICALRNLCIVGVKKDPAGGPSWIFRNDENIPDANLIIPFRNKLLSIDHFVKTGLAHESLFDLTPRFFDATQIPFNIDANDHGNLLPVNFLNWLGDIFNEDWFNKNCKKEAMRLIQQFFGYCLTNMTFAQKILLIIGPKRSGKGTLSKVIQAMLGSTNVTNPSAASLTERFPLESWPNKRLAIFGDARFSDKKEMVKELLLRISGGDEVNIERKSMTSLTNVSLPAKIMILSNDLPAIRDPSNALSSRFLVLKMTKSFYGNEDPFLFEGKLKPEIPLIFWWALDGLRDLLQLGYFVQPASGFETIQEVRAYEAPIRVFVEEFCDLNITHICEKKKLFNGYKRWCEDQGCSHLNMVHFVRNIVALDYGIKHCQPTIDGKQVRSFIGINLKDHV